MSRKNIFECKIYKILVCIYINIMNNTIREYAEKYGYAIPEPVANIPEVVPLQYPKTLSVANTYKNILLIDSGVIDYQVFVDSVNADTCPIVYGIHSRKTDLMELLQNNFTSISRIGLVFASGNGQLKMFLDNAPFCNQTEIEPYSENVQFIINIIKAFNVANIDYLGCKTLAYTVWSNYYNIVRQATTVIVGASYDKTGNIKSGGNWVMETTGIDIEGIYFAQSIKYYGYLLDNMAWSNDGRFIYTSSILFHNGYFYVGIDDGVGTYRTILKLNTEGIVIQDIGQLLPGDFFSYISSIAAYDDYLYVAQGWAGYISKISISNPSGDSSQGWFNGGPYGYFPFSLYRNNDYLYYTFWQNNSVSKLWLYDVAQNSAIPWIQNPGGTDDPSYFTAPGAMNAVGDYLFITNAPSGRSQISKISFSNDNDRNYNWVSSVGNVTKPGSLARYDMYFYMTTDVYSGQRTQISKISVNFPAYDTTPYWKTITNYNLGAMTTRQNYLYIAALNQGVILEIELPIICFKKNTKILTNNGYKYIQDLKKGDLVKTLKHGYKPVYKVGHKQIHHKARESRVKDQLYRCSQEKYPELFEDLIITGCHCILVDGFVDENQRQKTIDINGHTYVTDNKYRLPACADYRATVYETAGEYTIYNFALENDDYYMNYGVYANGLVVESSSKRFMTELSGMTDLSDDAREM